MRPSSPLLTLFIAVITISTVAFPMSVRQLQPSAPNADVDKHLREIARQLPSDSSLKSDILAGARGSGVHYAWMDQMAKTDIKRVVVQVDIAFHHNGRPKHSSVNHVEYFSEYDGGSPLSDPARLKAIRDSGLENQLESVALERVAHGAWVDVPRPRPKPFVGGIWIEFFDDEWLAVFPSLYFARNSSSGR